MKFYYTLLACALACTQTLFAQNDLVIFSPDGDKFYVFLNGEQQNQTPKANVKIKGLSDPALKAKVVFEDNSLANIDKTIYFNDEEPNQEHTYQIKLKKGKRSIAFFSYKPIADSKPNANQEVITFGTPAPAPTPTPAPTTTTTTTTTTTVATTSNTDPNANVNINMNAGPNGVSTTTNTTDPNANVNVNMNAGPNGVNTNVNNPPPNNGTMTRPNNNTNTNGNANVSINMNAGPNGAGVNTNVTDPNNPNYDPNFNMSINMNGDPNNPNFNMNVNISDPNANANPNYDPNYNPNVNINMNGNPNATTNTNTSTSTTYSTTTTTTSTTTTTNPNPTTTTTNPAPAPATTNNCAATMSELSFKRTMDKMKATTFDSEHLKISKEAVKKNCATTAQIKEIAQVMRHESSKLEFVKYAYTYCIDQQNYDELVDIFVHATNKDAVRNLLD